MSEIDIPIMKDAIMSLANELVATYDVPEHVVAVALIEVALALDADCIVRDLRRALEDADTDKDQA